MDARTYALFPHKENVPGNEKEEMALLDHLLSGCMLSGPR
jgi:hypothetical protein